MPIAVRAMAQQLTRSAALATLMPQETSKPCRYKSSSLTLGRRMNEPT